MAFRIALFDRVQWPTSVTEDTELHLRLVRQGVVVRYAERASVELGNADHSSRRGRAATALGERQRSARRLLRLSDSSRAGWLPGTSSCSRRPPS